MLGDGLLLLLVSAGLASVFQAALGESWSHLVTAPDVPAVEIGTNFTATCVIIETTEVTSEDLFWNLSKTTLPKESYTKINSTALGVTVPISGENSEWLFCLSRTRSHYANMNKGKFIHGILLKKGYRPERPENVSCVALQEKTYISPTFSCKWDVAGRQTVEVPTKYNLTVKINPHGNTVTESAQPNGGQVSLTTFPSFMTLEVWVEAHNLLGTAESEHLIKDSNYFVKTNPPLDLKVVSEDGFPTSLLINWTPPIAVEYIKLTYQIRFCTRDSSDWSYVPLEDTEGHTHSFRLQNLQPYTDYFIQIRCKHSEKNSGYWSDWSSNVTRRTPDDRPSTKPDLWITNVDSGLNGPELQLICKDPEFPNGRITAFDLRVKLDKGSWESESIPSNRSEEDNEARQRTVTLLKRISLANKQFVKVCLTASTSVGKSPEACTGLTAKPLKYAPVENMTVRSSKGQLFVEWQHLNNNSSSNYKPVSEYVIEWVRVDGGGSMNWQRQNETTRLAAIKGHIQPFVLYNVSVYPIYSGWIGTPTSKEAYLEQSAPSKGPFITKANPGHDTAELVWKEIPLSERRGFITSYIIYWRSQNNEGEIRVPPNTTVYTLKSLSSNTKYEVRIGASTIGGSANSSVYSFITLKYAPGMVESIVVGVSLSFLFLVLMIILLCFYKKDAIKENFWPQIPNPGESTIGNWSPDFPLKPETPKENCLSGICVLDEGMCDVKHGFEEDKASLSLKKDKFLSEEHSSGIGGSSCMSSPRHSMSDSDEGADVADTTASTVQYSSVVASSGYKGQTPGLQPQHSIFSRSESTQPLLDSEENPDVSVQEGSRPFQRLPRRSENREPTEPGGEPEQQDFYPIEEDTDLTAPSDLQSADPDPASVSSYMPQLGGYRPQ